MSETSTGEIKNNEPHVMRADKSPITEPAHAKTPQEKLREASENPVFNSSLLLQTLADSPGGNEINMAQLLQESAGVWEGYSINQHTQMAMGQFEKYFADGYRSSLLSRGDFRILLALHDIGKPFAIKAGDKRKQHEYTKSAMKKILKSFALPSQQHTAIIEIANQDYIGSYLQNEIGRDQTAENIKKLAQKINVPIADLTTLLITYYMCDAGSYTQDAGGERSLDNLFIFNREENQLKGTMKFVQPQQAKLNALLTSLAIKPEDMNTRVVLAESEIPTSENNNGIEKTARLTARLNHSESVAYRKNITDYVIEEGFIDDRLEKFFEYFPQYRNYSLAELKKAAPKYIDFYVEEEIPHVALSQEKAFGKFLYRGEGSSYRPVPEDLSNMIDILAVFKKQGGIGNNSSKPITFMTPSLGRSDGHIGPDGGIWVIKKKVLELKKIRTLMEPVDIIIDGFVPFKYVHKLLVTEEMRQRILQEYGEGNTELFGRPIEDVVMTYNPHEFGSLKKTVLKLNLAN